MFTEWSFFGILYHVGCFVCPDVSEEPAVSIFRVTEMVQVDPTVISQIPSHPNKTVSTRTNLVTLKMEAIHFSETSEQKSKLNGVKTQNRTII